MTNPLPHFTIDSGDRPAQIKGAREYFESEAPFWQEIYERADVYAVIHQERRAAALALVDELTIPPRSDILEIGCGAGYTSVALAKRGHAVTATDFAAPMLERARQVADAAGVGSLVDTRQCDIHSLPFPDNSFILVMAMGVLPWLPSMDQPMRELVRVLQPGGYLIVNVDNRWRLSHILDPLTWPRLAGIKIPNRLSFLKRYKGPPTIACSVGEFDALLSALGLEKVRGATLGFGPFWLISKWIPTAWGVKLHHILQGLADRRVPVFRSVGAQYITLSRKVGSRDA